MKQAGVPFFAAVGFGFSGSGKRCVQTGSRLRLTDRVRILLTALFAMGLAVLSASDLPNDTPFRITSSDQHRIVLELNSPPAQIDTEIINGMSYNRISLAGAESSAREGYPELPLYSGLLAIPANADYRLSYEILDTSVTPSVKPRPVQTDESKTNTISAVYFGDSPWPAEQVTSSEPAWLREFRVLPLQICPFSWNPESNTLSHYTNIRVTLELSYQEAEPIPYSGYSYAFREVYAAQILNFSDYRSPEPEPKNARILLIHGDNTDQIFLDKLKEFVIWKRQKGFEVDLASTSVAGTANTAIKDYIQARYNNPATRPDYIILLGDVEGSFAVPTWFETDSGYNGEGDYPYTHLSGTDLLGDVFIGRISAENISQLGTIFNKIYGYEKTINTGSGAADWLDRMLIIGDPTESGISCAYVSHHIREIARYAHPEYDFIENYESGFISTMNSGVNQGVGFFTYRGCYGVSGWTPSSSLVNGYKLPHAVILTCDTGTFSGTSLSENFIRLGTEAIPAGAVTCIGMSTIGTHTAFNNALIASITGGIFTHKMRNMGQALLNGKLYLHSLYNETQPDYVKAFAHWCNLMGDPTLETWVGIPAELRLELPDTLPLGTISFEIAISDSSQNPVEGVCVTAFCPDQSVALAKAFTGPDGIAHLSFSEPFCSDLLITASKHDYRPVQQTVSIDPAGSVCYASHQVIDNGTNGSSGNGDGSANATETIALEVALLNSTAQDMSSVKATLSTDNPKVQMILSQASYLAIGQGDTALGNHPFTFTVDPDIAAFETIRFYLNLSGANALHYESVFTVEASNACLSVSNYLVDQSGNGILDPGETCSLSLQISNSSLYSAFGLTGVLSSLNNLVSVSDSLSVFGDVYPSQQSNSVTEFRLLSRPGLVPGMQIPLRLRLFNDAGFEQSCSFNLPVGTVSQNTPLGPDEYGYLIYDQTDTGFPECPVYEWVELVPELGGTGSLVPDLFDNGIGNTEGEYFNARALKTLDLPFMFPFYGIYYDQITVCVNGFIAFGVTKDGDFRNAHLPGAQGPSPMIAAFWDDLFMRGTAGIYRYFDPVSHCYIIQYHELKNGYDGDSPEEFEVIFYDPVFYPTGKGDGMIKIQYKTFNNVDIGGSGYTPVQGNFCTVGIKDHTNTRGLQYSFNNTYPQAAAALGNETALLITTVPQYYQAAQLVANDVFIDDLNSNRILEQGETAGLGIELKNLGAAPANAVSARLLSSSPYISVQSGQSVYPAIPGFSSALNRYPFNICVSDSCPVETRLTLICEISSDENCWTYPVSFMVYKPSVNLDRFYLSDTDSNSNGILEPGETAVFIVNLENSTALAVKDLTCSLAYSGEYVSLLDTSQSFSFIPPHSTVQAAFRFSLSSTAALGTNVYFDFSYSSPQLASYNTQISLRVGGLGLGNDFENNNGNYTGSPEVNPWEWGTSEIAGSHSGTKVWGTKLNQQYPNNWNCELVSPPIYLGSGTYLEFWHYYDMEYRFDGGSVRISVDYEPWILLTPVGGYPSTFVFALHSAGFSGSSGWSFAQFDLSSYAGQNVRFNWRFSSGAQNQGQGWFIDDVYTVAYDNFAGCLSGEVMLGDGQASSAETWITNLSGVSVKADSTGAYQMYLPSGTHALQASVPGYQPATVNDLVLSQFTPLLVQDFSLIELKAISSFTPGHTIDAVQLSWQPPLEPYYPVTGYRVMRKLNAGAFEAVTNTQETSYTEVFGVPGSYSYYVQAIYEQGESLPGETYSVEFPFTVDPPIPAVTRLYNNYPNPFNPKTTISFDLAAKTVAELRIFNLRGQLVKTLWKGELEAGNYKFGWDGRNEQNQPVASGIYFYRLTGKGFSDTGKMALIK